MVKDRLTRRGLMVVIYVYYENGDYALRRCLHGPLLRSRSLPSFKMGILPSIDRSCTFATLLFIPVDLISSLSPPLPTYLLTTLYIYLVPVPQP
jgi:hypothetical protein